MSGSIGLEVASTLDHLLADHASTDRLLDAAASEAPDSTLLTTLDEVGLTELAVPEEMGGLGLGLDQLCLVGWVGGRRLMPTLSRLKMTLVGPLVMDGLSGQTAGRCSLGMWVPCNRLRSRGWGASGGLDRGEGERCAGGGREIVTSRRPRPSGQCGRTGARSGSRAGSQPAQFRPPRFNCPDGRRSCSHSGSLPGPRARRAFRRSGPSHGGVGGLCPPTVPVRAGR